MNFFRIPLNLIVVLILLQVGTCFPVCFSFLREVDPFTEEAALSDMFLPPLPLGLFEANIFPFS